MPRAGSARALTPGDVHRLLEQLADVVQAVRDIVRASRDGGEAARASSSAAAARRALEHDVRPLVFAGNCLWAAADGWQEHEALVDLQRYGNRALATALRMRDAAGAALDAAALVKAEHVLRALAASVLDDIEASLVAAAPAPRERASERQTQ